MKLVIETNVNCQDCIDLGFSLTCPECIKAQENAYEYAKDMDMDMEYRKDEVKL